MINQLFYRMIVVLILFTFVYQTTVYANSSWNWLTDSPEKFLPYAILLTLVIEIGAIVLLGRLKSGFSLKVKGTLIIILANIASFLLPYIYRSIEIESFYGEGWDAAWHLSFTSGPYYIVLLGFLFLTISVEVPIIYLYLKKHTERLRILLSVIIIANIVTTLIVAVMERIMFYGQW